MSGGKAEKMAFEAPLSSDRSKSQNDIGIGKLKNSDAAWISELEDAMIDALKRPKKRKINGTEIEKKKLLKKVDGMETEMGEKNKEKKTEEKKVEEKKTEGKKVEKKVEENKNPECLTCGEIKLKVPCLQKPVKCCYSMAIFCNQ